MKRLPRRWLLGACLFFLVTARAEDQTAAPNADASRATIYDLAPDHLWNRLHAALFLRVDAAGNVFGPDQLDALLWTDTTHLLTEPSYGRAIRALDEFTDAGGAALVPDPPKRAMLQRDLWAAFDWAVRMGNVLPVTKNADAEEKLRGLRARLAVACKRLALTREQIAALPDNYAAAVAARSFPAGPDPANPDAPFLPPDLFDPDGPWVCLGRTGEDELAQQHVGGGGGRSAFFAFLRLPGGRADTVAYLGKIRDFDRPWVPDTRPVEPGTRRVLNPIMPNPETPQIPPGSMVALVRRTILVDDRSELVASPLTEEVRLRVYHKIAPSRVLPDKDDVQSFHEFILNRREFFAEPARGGLRPRGADEVDFTFGPQIELSGKDPFDGSEPVKVFSPAMTTCVMCHNMPGVYSVNSIQDLFGSTSRRLQTLSVSSPAAETAKAIRFKQGYYFDRLRSLMETPPGEGR